MVTDIPQSERDIAYTRAFNLGCDARVRGVASSDNPYVWFGAERNGWTGGWYHAHTNWGTEARWPVKPLPPVGRMKEAPENAQASGA